MKVAPIASTLDGSKVTHVFLHHVTSAKEIRGLKDRIPKYLHYDQRALLLARPHDIVCVLDQVDRAYIHFLSQLHVGPQEKHILELKIIAGVDAESLAENVIGHPRVLETIRRLVPSENRVVLNPYCVSTDEAALPKKLEHVLGRSVVMWGDNQQIVAAANMKHWAYTKAQEVGVPVAPGEIVKLEFSSVGTDVDFEPLEAAIGRQLHLTGRVIVRGTDGASGSEIFMIESAAQCKAVSTLIKGHWLSNVYLVQAMFDIVASPNVQMFVSPHFGLISCVGVTDQILDEGMYHSGNVFPSNAGRLADITLSAEILTRSLQCEGYRGLVGLDFVEYVHPTTKKLEYVLAEINARPNAASYPSFLVEHMNVRQAAQGYPLISAFLATWITTTAKSFEELQARYGHLFFDRRSGCGVVPYNIGCLAQGRCNMAFLGSSRSEVEHMYVSLRALELEVKL